VGGLKKKFQKMFQKKGGGFLGNLKNPKKTNPCPGGGGGKK